MVYHKKREREKKVYLKVLIPYLVFTFKVLILLCAVISLLKSLMSKFNQK